MIKAKTKKICIVVSSLGKGGAERSSALLSEMLYDLGYDVHIVSVLNHIDYSYKGKLLNLGEFKAKDDSFLGRLKRLRIFKSYLREHNFDYIIDNRTRIGFVKEFIISRLIYNSKKTVYCVRSYKIDNYLNPKRFLGRLLYNSANRIVTVSKAVSEKIENIYGFKNVSVIYNAVDIDHKESINEIPGTYILFFGRLSDEIKNISLLLEAYSKSRLPKSNVNLKIMGDGKDIEKLKKRTEALDLTANVQFLSYDPNPSVTVKSALFTVLTSRYEGFPRSLTESLAMGTPVISVDCKSGPNEIIINESNGLLVENYNSEALAKAMDRFYEDKNLYLQCKSNAKKSVLQFSKENIGLRWKSILK